MVVPTASERRRVAQRAFHCIVVKYAGLRKTLTVASVTICEKLEEEQRNYRAR